MAIRLDPTTWDTQGLPVVSWEEDRNLFAPQGITPARVSCFIRPDENGVLQFVSVGLVRHGEFEEARPWQRLAGFEIKKAEEVYQSASERARLEWLASKSKSGLSRVFTTDGALVIVANFADDRLSVPMHLNCADCRPVEAAMVGDRLRLEFLDRRWDLIKARCNGKFVWPKDKAFAAHAPAVAAGPRRWMTLLADALILGILGSVGVVLYLFLRG